MFDGDIVCRSEYGKGANFVFIVALESEVGDDLGQIA